MYVYVAGRRAGLVMSYNLVSPHYTTTKAKSGGRKKVKEEEGDMKRRGAEDGGWGRYGEGSQWGVIREGWSGCPCNDTVR